MAYLSKCRLPRGIPVRLGLSAVVTLLLLITAGRAMAVDLAAEIADEEVYVLPEGETIEDDLVIFAREVTIDGTVEGDLVAFGQVIIVNGVVAEDVIAAGAEVQINGAVQDDVRAAGAAVHINGLVGDDVFVAGGSFVPVLGAIPVQAGDRTVISGLRTGPTASIGGTGYFAGGLGTLEGVFREDLFAAIGQLTFNAEVEGNARLYAESLTFGASANVAGDLRYAASTETGTARAGGVIVREEPEVAETERPGPERTPVVGFGWWLLRTILMVVGIVLVGLVLLRLVPGSLTRPVDTIERKTVIAGLYGILAAAAAVPISGALVFLAILFFGWFWGGASAFPFTFGFLLLAWVLSPVVTGLWLGRKIFKWLGVARGDVLALLVGASIIVLAGRFLGAIPCAGVLAHMVIYLLSFALAAGGILLSCFGDRFVEEA